MSTQNLAGYTATSHLSIAHQAIADEVNEQARLIATRTLQATDGRATFSWSGPRIEFIYHGDEPDGSYGKSTRKYRKNGGSTLYDRAPKERTSESGTGLNNLCLEDFDGCTDPVFLAKKDILFLLMDHRLGPVGALEVPHEPGLVGHVLRTTAGTTGLRPGSQLYDAVAGRLRELIEQFVLSNPGKQDLADTKRISLGLDLRLIAEGTNVVGWMAKSLRGALPPTIKRARENFPETTDWPSGPVFDGDSVPALSQAALNVGHLGLDAATQYEQNELLEAAQNASEDSASLHGHARTIALADHLHRNFGIPYLTVPDLPTRKAMLAQLEDEPDLPRLSLKAFVDLSSGGPTADQLDIPDAWVNLWASLTPSQQGALLSLASDRRGGASHYRDSKTSLDAPGLIAVATIGFYEPMTAAARTRATQALVELLMDSSRLREWRALCKEAVAAFDAMRSQGLAAECLAALRRLADFEGTSLRSAEEAVGILNNAL